MMLLISLNSQASNPQNLKLNDSEFIQTTLMQTKLFYYPIVSRTEVTVTISDLPYLDYGCVLEGVIEGKAVITFKADVMICFTDDAEYKSNVLVEGLIDFNPTKRKLQHIKKGHVIMVHVIKKNSALNAGVRG